MRPRRPARLSKAERKRSTNAWNAFYAGAAPDPQKAAVGIAALHQEVRPYKPRGPSRRLEAPVLDAIYKALLSHPAVARVRRRTVGAFLEGNRWVRVGRRGDPDVEGMLTGGQSFAIEVKAPGRQLDEHQRAEIERIKAGGGIAGCAHSVEEALAIIERGMGDRKPDESNGPARQVDSAREGT